jgi:nicotinamide-nucleotide amidase
LNDHSDFNGAYLCDQYSFMRKILGSIITIGDELLIGQVIDTNSAWMAQELNKIGVWVQRRVATGDRWDDIWDALNKESEQSDIILITGGLGPTDDDITKPLLCKYFGGQLVVDQAMLANVQHIFERVLKRPMIDRNVKQAEVPDNCTPILNKRGTAPGMWFEKHGKIFVSMPGVPHEMKGMMSEYVLQKLQEHFTLPYITHRTVLTAGIGESFLAESISSFEKDLPPSIKLAYLPNYGMVRLRLTATGDNKEATDKEVEDQFDMLKKLIEPWTVIDKDLTLQEVIGKLLAEKKLMVSTAESCTGGYISHLITSIPGSSEYFKGGLISYANEVKHKLLGVDEQSIATGGAVSKATVIQMLKGALILFNTDCAIATSGIMGPGGGSADKPVGTVWIAVGNRDQIVAQKFYFRFDRTRNIELASTNALNMLRKFITEFR